MIEYRPGTPLPYVVRVERRDGIGMKMWCEDHVGERAAFPEMAGEIRLAGCWYTSALGPRLFRFLTYEHAFAFLLRWGGSGTIDG